MTVGYLATKPLKRLRHMQSLIAAQLRSIWEQGSPRRLESAALELRARDNEVTLAIMQREFGTR